MTPQIVISILQAILANLPAEEAAVQGVIKFVTDMIALVQSGTPVAQSDIDALIASIQTNDALIQSKG